MFQHRVPHRISLSAGRYAVLEDARGTRVACADGTLWITQHADLRDIVLRDGESFVVDRDAKVIVHAISDATFALVSPPVPAASGPLGQRMKRWLSGDAAFATLRLSAG
ncbi:MAG: DUF2917 domain-containing protein [Rhodospirillales bacterium]|nr:DUF2917 domain-containing protein [Rhodospirillales bacterium]